jgi:predicted pyridoxine 5'-phosphate oxidase superfamily flavin-nucleotide-binding protein
MTLLNESVSEAARRSVLCWLATVDAEGQPNVAPSYRFYPHGTTEASQVASGMRTYNVQAVEKEKP